MVKAPASRKLLFFASSGMGFTTLSLSSLSVLVPLYGVDVGASPFVIGVIVSTTHLLPLLLAINAGRLVDSKGSGNLLLVGAIGLSLAPLLLVFWPSLPLLVVAQMLAGLFHMISTVASQAFVSNLPGNRQSNVGIFTAILSVGQLIGPLVAGGILDYMGFRAAFSVVSGSAMVNVAVAAWLRRSSAGRPSISLTAAGTTRVIRRNVQAPGVQIAILASCAIFAGMTVYQTFLPVLLSSHGASATLIGSLFSVRSLAAVLVRPAMPLVVRAFGGQYRTLVLMLVFVAVGTGLSGSITALLPLTALALLVGVGMGVGVPLSIVAIASSVDRSELGLLLGLRLFTNRLAQLASTLGVGALIGIAGFNVAFLATAAVALGVAATAVSRLKLVLDRPEAQSADP